MFRTIFRPKLDRYALMAVLAIVGSFAVLFVVSEFGGWGVLYIGLAVVVYFLPTIVGSNRKVPNIGSIVAINVFLGWTLIGWVVALAMALRSVPPTVVPVVVPAAVTDVTVPALPGKTKADMGAEMKRCPDCAELVQSEARVCRFCRYEFDAGTRAGTALPRRDTA